MEKIKIEHKTVFTEMEVMNVANDIIQRQITHRNKNTEDCITSKALARQYGLELFDLLSLLEDLGVVVYKRRHYQLAPQLEGQGLAKIRYFFCYNKKGERKEKPHLVWTDKGVNFITKTIKNLKR